MLNNDLPNAYPSSMNTQKTTPPKGVHKITDTSIENDVHSLNTARFFLAFQLPETDPGIIFTLKITTSLMGRLASQIMLESWWLKYRVRYKIHRKTMVIENEQPAKSSGCSGISTPASAGEERS